MLFALVLGSPVAADAGSLEHVARAFARATGSMPLLARRLSSLRQVVAAVAAARGLDSGRVTAALDRVTVAATQAALAELEDAALTDALTETGNRRALEQAARAALATAARTGQPLSVVAIDLDGLKAINDTQGHAAGDQALAGLSAAVRAALRATDQLFRIGGDEFVVLLPLATAEMVAELVRRMQLFNSPKFSWGAATTPVDGTELEALLRVADSRLYASRQASGYRRERPLPAASAAAPAGRSAAHHWARAAAVAAVSMAAVAVLAIVLGAGPGTPRPTVGTTQTGQSSTTTSPAGGTHHSGGGSGSTTIESGGSGGSGSTSTSAPNGGGGGSSGGGSGSGSGGTGQGGSTTTTTAPLVTVPTTTIPLPVTTTTTTIRLQLPRITLPKL